MSNGIERSRLFRRILDRIPFRISDVSRLFRRPVVEVGASKARAKSTLNENLNKPSKSLLNRTVEAEVQEKFAAPPVALTNRKAEHPSFLAIKEFLRRVFGFNKAVETSLVRISTGRLGEFELDSRILPALPKGASTSERATLLAKVAEKIEMGCILYDDIVNGRIDPKEQPATLEDISNLMWFLQVKAEKKSAVSFTSGAISIEDKDLQLLKYLDSCKEVYQRSSSHIKEFQAFNDDKNSGVHRGIDFNPKHYNSDLSHLSTILPYGQRTLLIGPMFQASGLIDENRVLLKMEPYGAYHFKPIGGYRLEPRSREENPYDFGHAVGHAWKYLRSQGPQTGVGTKKERVPAKIKNAYKKIVEGLKKNKSTKGYAAILEKGKPFSTSAGIRIMATNIETLILQLSKMEKSEFPSAMQPFLKPLHELYNTITDPKQYDNYRVRIGNEVIFKTNELSFS